MLRRISILAFVGVFVFGDGAAAQGVFDIIGEDLKHAKEDVTHVWTSPLRVDGDALPELTAVTAAVGLTAVFDDEIQNWLREHPESLVHHALAPFDEGSLLEKAGYSKYLFGLSGALYLSGLAVGSEALRHAGIGCATSTIANNVPRTLLNALIGRLRPEYTRDPYVIQLFAFGGWPMQSFPSGHAATPMACTAFWNGRYDLGVAEPALYLLASGVGLARVPDGAHWTSDVVFSIIYGWAIGNAIAERFRERDDDGAAAQATAARTAPVITIGWRLRF